MHYFRKIGVKMNKNRIIGLSYLFLFSFLLFSFVSAQQTDFNYVVSNSEDWRDVYSIIHYSNLKGIGSDFLVGPRHGQILASGLNKENDIRIITSKDEKFVFNYAQDLKNQGFNVDEIEVEDANIELIEDLENINNFIIVSDDYGYNAIAVVPYAVQSKSWVFFANSANIDDIDSIISQRNPESVLIYGIVDEDVKIVLQKYDPEIIDNEDRFEDNIEIVKKYRQSNSVKQVLLSNGEFIEKEVMSGVEPVLFTGKENVPDSIRDYIKSSDLEVGVLVGADLVGAATNIRRSTGISVIVKFARGSRNPAGAISAVEGLDLFYLPSPFMDLDITSAKLNRASSQLEITYFSKSNLPVFFKGTINLDDENGDSTRIGDLDPIFIAPNNYKTVVYPGINFTQGKLSADILTLYGESRTSLEKILEKRLEVGEVNIIDGCVVNILEVKYSIPKKSFIVELLNEGNVGCWVNVELKDIEINGHKKTIGSSAEYFSPGKKVKIEIKQDMSESDLNKNAFVNVAAYFGEREDNLLKTVQGKFELKIERISYATIGYVALALIVIMIIIYLIILFKRRKKKDDDDFL